MTHVCIGKPPPHPLRIPIDRLRAPKNLVGHRDAGAGVIGFDSESLHFAVLDDDSVPLGPVPAEDGRAVKGQVEGPGELAGRVRQESDLGGRIPCE